jgi:hypothetical protein
MPVDGGDGPRFQNGATGRKVVSESVQTLRPAGNALDIMMSQ